MLLFVDRVLAGMAVMRAISGFVEIAAAYYIMFHVRRIEDALRINAILGAIGPVVFVAVSALGLASLAGRVSAPRLIVISAGMALVLWGTSG
ncbi:MAG TPA: DUF2619 domain-containing protein [Clostridia bacterium]|nr:DUF2619 domain-containing protein [Clostridia bacterium]